MAVESALSLWRWEPVAIVPILVPGGIEVKRDSDAILPLVRAERAEPWQELFP